MRTGKISMNPEEITEKEVNFLFHKWNAYWVKKLIHKGFTPMDAEDIVQSALMYFWEFRHSYNNKFSVYTYFYQQMRKAVSLHLQQERRTEASIQAVRENKPDALYEMLDEEQPEDILDIAFERMPEELAGFLRAYLITSGADDCIQEMKSKGFKVSADDYHRLRHASFRYIPKYCPELYTEMRDLLYGKATQLPKAQQVRKFVRTMEEGDHITLFRNKQNAHSQRVLMEEVAKARELGAVFDIEDTSEYVKVTRMN